LPSLIPIYSGLSGKLASLKIPQNLPLDRLKREFRVSQINKVWVAGTTLVTDALTMLLSRRDKAKDVIVHSDHGSTYAPGD